jgi:hypothetical protein
LDRVRLLCRLKEQQTPLMLLVNRFVAPRQLLALHPNPKPWISGWPPIFKNRANLKLVVLPIYSILITPVCKEWRRQF